jgi:hypothetical protein
MMVLAARAIELAKGAVATGTPSDITKFNDGSQVDHYAIAGVSNLVKEGITATRAEAAVMIYKLLKM